METPSRRMLAAAMLVTALAARGTPSLAAAEDWKWPLSGRVITSYANDNTRPYAGGMHRGIDIAAPVGTKVVAAHAGRVTYAGSLGSSGLTVAIETSDARHVTSYLHLSQIAVGRGAAVAAGDDVGEVGTTGTRSAGEPHLHFGVRLAGSDHLYVDPLTLLPPPPGATRDAPLAAVPVPHQVRPRTAPAAIQPSPLVSPRAQPVLLPGAPRPASRPLTSPRGVPVPARLPAEARVPLAGNAPELARIPAPVQERSDPARAQRPGIGNLAPLRSPGPEGRRGQHAVAQPLVAAPAPVDWGKPLSLGGLALLAAVLGRRASSYLRAHGRHQRPQQRARPARPSRARLAGISQVS